VNRAARIMGAAHGGQVLLSQAVADLVAERLPSAVMLRDLGLAGTPSISPGNYFLQPGSKTLQAIISEIKQGLYVTEFLGHGVNLVTGDYSRGASGLWISGGELSYPVEEITVAGNLKDIFFNISEIANDLEFRGSVACPTIRIDGLTVGGE